MNAALIFFITLLSSFIGGFLGFGMALLIFWPELKRPDQCAKLENDP